MIEWKGELLNAVHIARREDVDYPLLLLRWRKWGDIDRAVDDLKANGHRFHERAKEFGATGKNKTGIKGPKRRVIREPKPKRKKPPVVINPIKLRKDKEAKESDLRCWKAMLYCKEQGIAYHGRVPLGDNPFLTTP